MTAIEYISLIDKIRNTRFRITPYGSFYIVDDREIPVAEFEATYKLPFKVRPDKHNGASNRNLDSKKSWLYDD